MVAALREAAELPLIRATIEVAEHAVDESRREPGACIQPKGRTRVEVFEQSVRAGVFTVPGDGCVDYVVQTVRRGSILDRDGDPLAYDGSASVIGVVPGQFQDEEAEVKAISKIVDIDAKDIKAMYADSDPGWFVPIKQYPNQIDDATKTKISQIPGAALRSQTARIYPLGQKAALATR